MTTKVKKKQEYKDYIKEVRKENEEVNERLKKKDYILTVYQKGDKMMSGGEYERQLELRRFFAVCSLEEIPDYIKWMKEPFWGCPKGLSKKEIKNYPFKKKKWGQYYDLVIEPLSEEMEKNYIGASKEGFFESHRMIHQRKTEREKL